MLNTKVGIVNERSCIKKRILKGTQVPSEMNG